MNLWHFSYYVATTAWVGAWGLSRDRIAFIPHLLRPLCLFFYSPLSFCFAMLHSIHSAHCCFLLSCSVFIPHMSFLRWLFLSWAVVFSSCVVVCSNVFCFVVLFCDWKCCIKLSSINTSLRFFRAVFVVVLCCVVVLLQCCTAIFHIHSTSACPLLQGFCCFCCCCCCFCVAFHTCLSSHCWEWRRPTN